MNSTKTAIRLMAEWLVGLTASDLPKDVSEVAKRATIDTIGVALAGSRTDVATYARRVADVTFTSGPAALWGHAYGFSAAGAAFTNGVAAHALDYDDNCYAGFVHASAVIVPAAWAAAQAADRSGDAYLTSYVAGAECEFAVAAAMGLAPYERGWWTTGLYGVVGACAAVCHALQLDVDATASALGLAIAATGGSKAGFGTDAKALMVGNAAQMGVTAAFLARNGCRGPEGALDGPNGLAALSGADGYHALPFTDLGNTWRLLAPGLDVKRIPVCLSSHAAVDALRDLRAEGLNVHDIERVICDVPPIVEKNLVYARPVTRQQAQFSMPFSIAATLLYGDVTLGRLDAALLSAADLVAAMARVHMVSSTRWADPGLLSTAPEGVCLRVELRDGRVLERFRAAAVGTTASPMSLADFDRKFLDCAAAATLGTSAETLLAALKSLDSPLSIRSLTV